MFWQFVESEALSEWMALKEYAASLGIRTVGDMPIYVSEESSEMAYHKEWFWLDENARPAAVAGVPPDYFCEDGQLWGNPLYDWKKMKADGYALWRKRIRHMLTLFDGIRKMSAAAYIFLDSALSKRIRGLKALWRSPYAEKACS